MENKDNNTKEFCGIKVNSPFFLAPMAAVTALPFRLTCKKMGAGLTITEQINCTQISRNPDAFTNNEFFTIRTVPEEKPVGVQLFGVEEKDFITAVELVEKNFDLININCGCPAPRETSIGAGAALLKKPEKIASIVSAIKGVTDKPVTAKIRLGWNENNAVRIAKVIEKAGADAIMVHGRTAEQKYMGESSPEAIKEVKEAVSCEVVANGDVTTGKTAEELLHKTGCSFGMIGREAMKNPFIFKEINEHFKGREWEPEDKERVEAFFDYLDYCKRFNMIKVTDLKAKAVQFTKGIGFTKKTRVRLIEAKSEEEIVSALKDFLKTIN